MGKNPKRCILEPTRRWASAMIEKRIPMPDEEYDKAAEHWTSKETETVRMPEDELRAEVERFLAEHYTCARLRNR